MITIKKGICALLLAALGLGCVSIEAAAQLLSLSTGGSAVSITSPASGSTVSGLITVSASVNVFFTAGVQFKLDGANLGAEDTSAPYTTNWNTSQTTNSNHTLTAVARDVFGTQYTSDPVTVLVSNTAPPPAATVRYEETDPSVIQSAGWSQSNPNWFAWSSGTAVESVLPGAQIAFTFKGTSATWIGYRSGRSGIASVSLDGNFVSEVDLFARMDEVNIPVFKVSGLAYGTHTLTITATGRQNPEAVSNVVLVDAFDVPVPVVSHLQDTDPDASYSSGWSTADANIAWSGGSATVSDVAGAQVTLPFNGTAIQWRGAAMPDTGVAHVYIDGALAGDVDTYSSNNRIQAVLFAASGLTDGNHNLTISVAGVKNPASAGTRIIVDSFDVTSPGRRIEETEASVSYTGNWVYGNLNRAWSLGTASESMSPGAQATVTFTGTTVSWIGCRKPTTGIARVYLDGAFVAEIDTYRATEGLQDTVFKAAGLAPGTHILTVEATGLKNPAASNAWVVVDAFDVRP